MKQRLKWLFSGWPSETFHRCGRQQSQQGCCGSPAAMHFPSAPITPTSLSTLNVTNTYLQLLQRPTAQYDCICTCTWVIFSSFSVPTWKQILWVKLCCLEADWMSFFFFSFWRQELVSGSLSCVFAAVMWKPPENILLWRRACEWV